ncbi:MAG: hypothetical protein A2W98_02475 [Bacteroidetes bacterium GWF2_33_38]|nr:MAG: hypothetical protein A2W98_02475 [Bacteroidetes bacterium GWF2_33_38]OFY92401.1 MAG: hypothetical protein A2236_01975 [Bacteroidetes bacterium RIFOXYA2_FULL_33_7]
MIIIPEFEQNILTRKREMLRELTNSAISILSSLNNDENDSLLTTEEAKKQALEKIASLRYGDENKDYFWITDLRPYMVIHPYRADLNGTDLSNFEDAHGKKLFVEFVDTVKQSKEGFVDYMWQWKDDSTKIVPKLSYVKLFEPWGWIIGTGIYIEDVKEEINKIENRLLKISLFITIIIVSLLLIVLFQSFRIEKRRILAEENLSKSREKYKTLVEASTEGTLMIFKGSIIYSNKIIEDLLGYSKSELFEKYILKLFLKDESEKSEGIKLFNDAVIDKEKPNSIHQAQLIRKDHKLVDVEINTSKMQLEKDEVFILKIKEQSEEKKEFGKEMNKFKLLTDNIKIGIFRATLGRKSKIIEANPALLNIIGVENVSQLADTSILDLFNDKSDKQSFLNELNTNGAVKNKVIRLRRQNATINTIAVSAVLVLDENGESLYCDGVIEDITEQKQVLERQENLIMELQTSLLFLSQPLRNFTKELPICNYKTLVFDATKIMSKKNSNAILISSDSDDIIGIITDFDIRKRFVSEQQTSETQVFKIMTSPIISISDSAMLFEAISLMQEKRINHLAVKDGSGKIISVLNNEDLLMVHRNSVSFLKREIENSTSVEQIAIIQKRLPLLISTLIGIGANASNITRLTSIVFDSIMNKLIELAQLELGQAPAKFAFVVLGSAGRDEQTLSTDQDNIIIYDDSDEKQEKENGKYFLKLGSLVCDWLNEVGYNYCKGEIMAKNPKWNKPLHEWNKYFRNWILKSEPQDLLNVNIFLDLRTIFGDNRFINEIQQNIFELTSNHRPFLIYLTDNTQRYKAPLNMFGNIVLGSSKEKPDTFDIKSTMVTFVDFARIYSIKYKISEINTQKRLKQLVEKTIISEQAYKDFINAYDFLMQLRFKHQVEQIASNQVPDNYINPEKLSNIEKSLLKKVFGQMSDFLSKLNYEIKGTNINT